MFRPPSHGSWLAVLVGTGTQLFFMTLITLLFATLGFLSPANRGGLMTAVLLLYVFLGSFAGYSSARLYKTFKARGAAAWGAAQAGLEVGWQEERSRAGSVCGGGANAGPTCAPAGAPDGTCCPGFYPIHSS